MVYESKIEKRSAFRVLDPASDKEILIYDATLSDVLGSSYRRIASELAYKGFETVSSIISCSRDELLRTRNVGPTRADKIVAIIRDYIEENFVPVSPLTIVEDITGPEGPVPLNKILEDLPQYGALHISVYYDLTCDRCARSWSTDFNANSGVMTNDGGMGMARSWDALNSLALRTGWKNINNQNLCPECAARRAD